MKKINFALTAILAVFMLLASVPQTSEAQYNDPSQIVLTPVPAGVTDTSDIVVMATAGAGRRNYATLFTFYNSSATDTAAYICNGTCATAANRKLIVPVPAGAGAVVPYYTPFRTSTDTTVCVAAVTGVTTFYASAHGYRAR